MLTELTYFKRPMGCDILSAFVILPAQQRTQSIAYFYIWSQYLGMFYVCLFIIIVQRRPRCFSSPHKSQWKNKNYVPEAHKSLIFSNQKWNMWGHRPIQRSQNIAKTLISCANFSFICFSKLIFHHWTKKTRQLRRNHLQIAPNSNGLAITVHDFAWKLSNIY